MIDLSACWEKIEQAAHERLASNGRTTRQVSDDGRLELLGAAGERAAREFLELGGDLHIGLDEGRDMTWKGWKLDVKTTKLAGGMAFYHLQWPVGKQIKPDIVFLWAVDLSRQWASPLGWTWGMELAKARINHHRPRPCYEIRVTELFNPYALWGIPRRGKGYGSATPPQSRPSESATAPAWRRSCPTGSASGRVPPERTSTTSSPKG